MQNDIDVEAKFMQLFKEEPRKNHAELFLEILPELASSESRFDVYSIALSQLRRFDEVDRYLAIFNLAVGEFPDRSILWCGHAGFYLYDMRDCNKALETVEVAIDVSRRTRRFRRHSLSIRAEIAIALRDKQLWIDSIEKILAVEFIAGDLDLRRSRDITKGLPPSLLNSDAFRKYAQYLDSPLEEFEPDIL
jgi:hypothetical protein